MTGNRLTVTGKREAEKEDKGDTYYTYERSYGSFTRSFTLPDGITANAICPGVVDTDIRVGSTPENEAKLSEAVPMKRQCKPEEIAALYVWLSSADAGYITGTTQNINGGAYIA